MPVNSCLRWSPKDNAFQVYGCPSDMPINRCLRWSPITQKPTEACVKLGLLMSFGHTY